jgi:TIGR03009 family protein
MDMRKSGLTCTAFCLIALPLSAQSPTPTPPPPSPARLDLLLKEWEKKMATVENFSTKVTLNELHALTRKSSTFIGEAAFMRPSLARIDLTHQDEIGKKDTEKTKFRRMFCNEQYLYEYSPTEKKIIVHDIPKNDAAIADNLILSFLRGMKAEDAKKRFSLTLTKETEWYAYLYILPKSAADKQEFTAAQLTIFVKNPNPASSPNLTMMPCRLWYRQPNGAETTYLFSDMQPNGKVDKESFVPRQITGYTVERAGAALPMNPKQPPKK